MRNVAGGVTAPKGFRAAGVAVGVKLTSSKKDCALIVSDKPATVAGVFTRNLVKAAPVLWCQNVCAGGSGQAIFANSGNANACTGERGLADARAMADQLGSGLGIPPETVCVCSTGVIGVPLPMERIRKGVSDCIAALSPSGGADAAVAIMTTDTVLKEMAVEVALSAGTVRIGAIAKGAGMFAPNVATMLCFITTDAAIDAAVLTHMLRDAAAHSFNQVCVDNDTSTNDTVLCLANGQSGVPLLEPGSDDYGVFADAFQTVCCSMAKQLVQDGEGATKFVTIEVVGAQTDHDARIVARAIASSQLCKTAFFGQDPNWGRIACAAGYSGASFDPRRLAIRLGDIDVMRDGMPTAFVEADAAAVMAQREFCIHISVGDGPGRAEFHTCDLSHDYVSINADYRT